MSDLFDNPARRRKRAQAILQWVAERRAEQAAEQQAARQRSLAFAKAATERAILDQHAAAGTAPVYTGGILLSPSLLAYAAEQRKGMADHVERRDREAADERRKFDAEERRKLHGRGEV